MCISYKKSIYSEPNEIIFLHVLCIDVCCCLLPATKGTTNVVVATPALNNGLPEQRGVVAFYQLAKSTIE
jgi:hypothetical protein